MTPQVAMRHLAALKIIDDTIPLASDVYIHALPRGSHVVLYSNGLWCSCTITNAVQYHEFSASHDDSLHMRNAEYFHYLPGDKNEYTTS